MLTEDLRPATARMRGSLATARPAASQPSGASTGACDGARSLEIGVLGSLEVRRDGQAVPIRRGLPRALLCSLVLNRGNTVSADTLVEHLWSESIPVHPSNALQSLMTYLRRALGGIAVAPIKTRPAGYVLDIADDDVDVRRFAALQVEGRRLRALGTQEALTSAIETYEQALALWRGRPFSDVAGLGFADIEIVRLEELHLVALEEKADVLLALGRASEAAAELGALVTAHPLRERLQELLIVALYRTGRQADALRAYARARATLAEELGVEPSTGLRNIEQRVLLHDVGLDWAPPPRTEGSTARVLDPVPPVPQRLQRSPTAAGPVAATQRPGSELIGRDHEFARVAELLAECRLLTLTGPGGAGKSRLAFEVAASQAEFRVVSVDVASADEADVGATILTELGVPMLADVDPAATISAALGDDACLLVLDTCERIVGGLGPIVETLLATKQHLTVLATSRRPLGVVGEIAWPVPPLALPTEGNDPQRAPAFEFFVRRARLVNPDLVLDEPQVEAIAELCRALDGLPLAIELAAAQMDVLSPTAIGAHLSERPLFSVAGGPERQRTLSATTEWSVGLLDDAERDVLYRLAVFAPTFDLEAAIAVSGCEAAFAVGRFVTLVRSSLVAHDGGDRYRLLDTMRTHLVATDGDEQRLADARRRHAEHYASLAARARDKVRTPSQSTWMPRLRADSANLRQALGWCFGPEGDEQLGARFAADIAWVWTLQGNLPDSRDALDRASSVDAPPVVRAGVLLGIGLLAAPMGDHDRAREACLESAEIGRSLNDDRTTAGALLTLGVAYWATGDLEAAAAAHDEGIALFHGVGDLWGETICRILRARTARDAGELDLTEALLDIAVDDAMKTGDNHVIGLAYEQYAWLCVALGDNARAAAGAQACLSHNESLGYPEGICAALGLLSRIRLNQGDAASARQLQLRVLGLASGIGHIGALCAALEAIGEIDASVGDHRRAALLLLHAQRARRHHLPLPPGEAERIGELVALVRDHLGAAWDDVANTVPVSSVSELVRSMLEHD